MTQLKSAIRRYVARLGFLPAAFVAWRTLRTWTPSIMRSNRALRKNPTLPIPSDSLIFAATATKDVDWFLRSGEEFARALQNALGEIGRPLTSFSKVLDFGCGSGRVLRHWATTQGPAYFGCDYNPLSVAWNKENLRFAQFSENAISPPLPYEAGSFDLCYSVSVLTHLPERLQRPWVMELQRVIAPGGILILTLSGRGDLARLTASEQSRFERGDLVVLDALLAGTNMCAVYHPLEYVRREWSDLFTLLSHYPSGAAGSPNQDLYVFKRVD
jgi:SAM-dependent methyltransferase